MKKVRWVACVLAVAVSFCAAKAGRAAEVKAESTRTETLSAADVVAAPVAKEKSAAGQSATKKTLQLDEVFVTATRTPYAVGDLPVSTALVSRQDIDESTAHFADEALKDVPGAYLKRQKFSDAIPTVTLRGFSGSPRTLVMRDGQPLNDGYSAAVPWPAINLADVERIEVAKGPFSSLYGGNAMGGAINIITKAPTKREICYTGGYGTYETWAHSLVYTDRIADKVGIYFSMDNKSTNGYRNLFVNSTATTGAVTGYQYVQGQRGTWTSTGTGTYQIGDKGNNYWDQWGFTGKMVWDVMKDTKLSFQYSNSQIRFGYSEPRSYLYDSAGNEIDNGRVFFNDTARRRMTVSSYQFLQGDSADIRNFYQAELTTVLRDIGFKTRFGVNDDDTWYITTAQGATRAAGGPGTLTDTNPKRTYQLDTQADIPLFEKHTLTVGGSHRYNTAYSADYVLTDWQDPGTKTVTTSYMDGDQLNEALFAQLDLEPAQSLHIIPGIRLDYWKNYNGRSYSAPFEYSYPRRTNYSLSPKVAGGWTPRVALIKDFWTFDGVRASFGKAFRTPTLYDLYKTWDYLGKIYASNASLGPETSYSWEAGIDHSFFNEKTKCSWTFFESYISGLIYNQTLTNTLVQKQNAGNGRITGMEAELKHELVRGVSVFANTTYTLTKITDNEADDKSVGKRFQYVPKNMYNLGFQGKISRFEGSLTWRWVGKVYQNSDNSDKELGVFGTYDAVKLLDAKITCEVVKGVQIGLYVDNILDRDYYQYYRSPGRTWFGELKVKF